MRTITNYECEICGETSGEMKYIIQCESRGIPELPPIGLIYGSAKGFYKDITFCIAKTEVAGHYVINALWACRDNGAGDNLGKELCGDTSGYGNNWRKREPPSKSHPTFQRMLKYLKKAKVKPLMLQRGKVVTAK